jgi:hypothetical protein
MQFDADKTAFISGLYHDILGRAPDAEGLRFWEEYPDENLVAAFKVEAQKELEGRKYFIRGLYHGVLDREPDEEGFAFWQSYKPWDNLTNAFRVEAQKELDLKAA